MEYTITDTLGDIVDSATDDVKDAFLNFLSDEKPEDWPLAPDWSDLDYDGTIHEIIDSSVPVYTKEQKDLWYIHGDEAESLFEDHFGNEAKGCKDWPMGWQAAALYCLIEDRVRDWWDSNIEDIFDEWYKSKGQ